MGRPKARGQTEHVVLRNPNGEIANLADEFLRQRAAEPQADGVKRIARGQLVGPAGPFHRTTSCGRQELQGTISVRGSTGEVPPQSKNA